MKKTTNNLYNEYEKLSHYSFEDKIGYCFNHALDISRIEKIDLSQENEVYPWELEYLAELCILASEDEPTAIVPMNVCDMNQIINVIRNYRHSHFREVNNSFINDIFMALAATQFKVQENIYNRLFRYSYYFNYRNDNIDIKNEFKQTFGCDYYDFLLLAINVRFFLTKDITSFISQHPHKVWNHILSYCPHAINQLTITRDKYIEKQTDKNAGILENGLYGFNYLHSFPFINYKENLYFPLPYLIVDAVTDSLFTRLTYGNDTLRETIGKQTAESYLNYLLCSSDDYDEVYREQEYKVGKNKKASPDVMIRKGERICLFDSKLSSPSLSLRQFDTDGINNYISRVADYVVQLYKRIKEFDLYNPFIKSIDYSRDNIFGIVSIHEDAYILKETIYQSAFTKLEIDDNHPEAEYIASHIMVFPLSEIEKYALSSTDVFPALAYRCNHRELWMDYVLGNKEEPSEKKAIPAYDSFMDYVESAIKVATKDLIDKGLI